MIDVSDGLSADLAHICEESRVGAEIEAPRLPLSPALRRLPPARALDFALNGGEDFELLFTVRPRERHRRLLKGIGRRHPVATIGRVTARPGLVIVDGEGNRRPLTARGYEHFRG
jgi:thiamine-monophosphate kinase